MKRGVTFLLFFRGFFQSLHFFLKKSATNNICYLKKNLGNKISKKNLNSILYFKLNTFF